MKVRLPLMVQDRPAAAVKGFQPVEHFVIERDDVFLDGPVSGNLAVLDLDPKTNQLRRGARFLAPTEENDVGSYQIANETDYEARDFMQVSVFATVLRTIQMFEEEDTLGRPLTWAFDAPQLLLVPRAGEWPNAFYERESHSLQFFYFPTSQKPPETIYTGLSHDIVSHEAGHAILDGIAPDLYNAVTPESLALHEAIADLTALVMAFRNKTLSETVLAQTNGSIENSTAFTRLAEQFGQARDPSRRAFYLRNLLNQKTLDESDSSVDELGRPNLVARDDPHELSQVLSGALYTVMVRIHNQLKKRYAPEYGGSEYSASGKALFVGVERFKRMIFRALDYLPPGDVSFADYGRAVFASDQASHPGRNRERTSLCQEFVRRNMAPSAEALETETNFHDPALADVDLQTLLDSDWAAYDFANRHRDLLGIPVKIPFRVRPRLDTSKLYYHHGGEKKTVRELVLKVSWVETEPNPEGRWFPAERQITSGTTLAIDWDTHLIRARLTSEVGEQREERDRLLLRLDDDDVLLPARQATAPDGEPLRSVLRAESSEGVMRVRGAARMLHLAGRQ